MRDFQKSKVYAWEAALGLNSQKDIIPFDECVLKVNEIWEQAGLEYPPRVIVKPKNVTSFRADAGRTKIRLDEEGDTLHVLLHEISHSMTNDGHGPQWMGIYMKLLDKYNVHPLFVLITSANAAGLKYDLTAKPYFLD